MFRLKSRVFFLRSLMMALRFAVNSWQDDDDASGIYESHEDRSCNLKIS